MKPIMNNFELKNDYPFGQSKHQIFFPITDTFKKVFYNGTS